MIETVHQVTLHTYSPIQNAIYGARICTDTARHGVKKNDTVLQFCIDKGHWSVLEHINYTFIIQNISRSLLQQIARHRHISMSVQSTRYTLQRLNDVKAMRIGFSGLLMLLAFNSIPTEEHMELLVDTADELYEGVMFFQKEGGMTNDELKYFLPESYPTSLMLTLNARALMEMFQKRTGKEALKEFRFLCLNLYKALPQEHQNIYKDVCDWKALEYYFIQDTMVLIDKTIDKYPDTELSCRHS